MMSESLQFIDQYSLALSDLALAAHPSLDLPKVHGIIDSRSAAVKKQLSFALEGVRRSALSTCLSSPLIQFASTPGGRPVCISLSIAWSSYVSSLLALRHKSDPQADIMMGAKTLDDEMIEMGMTLVLIGTAASVSASASVHHKSSPMVLSGGEMPLIESCCIYVLREIISSSSAHASKPGSVLGEVWRKRFLSQLSSMLSPGGEALSYKGGQSAPLSPPSIVIALKAISLLLDASGELLEDAWEKSQEQQLAPFSSSADVSPTTTSSIHFDPRLIKAAVVSQSSHLSSSVRHQAALTFESLALASPSSCSQMLSSALSALTGASTVLSSSSTPTSSPSTPLSADIIDKPDLDTSLGPFTILPSFPLSPPSPSHPIPTHTTNHTIGSQMAHVHGLALSVSSLIATASRLPLGCPSILFLNALALASKLVMRPRSIGVNGRAIEVEAGLILVGGLSLHSCLKQDGPMEGRTEQIMDLLNQTLGGEEAGEIDVLATRLSIHEVQLAHLNKNKIKGDILSTQTAAAVVQSIHEELCMKLWTQSAALRCIPTLIHHLLTLQENNNEVIAHISSLLSTLLNSLGDFIPGHTSKLLDVRASSGLLNACIVTFQFRLLKAFLSLPSPQWSSLSPRTHEQLFALSSQNMTLKTESTGEVSYPSSSTFISSLILWHSSPADTIRRDARVQVSS